ncbi:MAG: glycoside hydrolase family 97 protein [Flavisolibacter sp.]
MKLILFIILLFSLTSFAQKKQEVSSPDGNIIFSFRIENSGPAYGITYKKIPVISKSSISLSFKESGVFRNNLKTGRITKRKGEENYVLFTGRNKNVHAVYNEMLIPLVETQGALRTLNFIIRVFNDGVAFRYQFPQQQNQTSLNLTDESTQFRFTSDPEVIALLLPNFTSSHEGEYTSLPLSRIRADTLMDMPALFELPGGVYASITEAALVDYAGMYLRKHNAVLSGTLSPLPGQTELKVKALLPHQSPWRVIQLSDRVGSFLESNILTSLNEPSMIIDVSWIKPGKTTFPWWNGNVVPDTINAPGNNFVTNQYYIDFCARNGITYHTVVEYGLHQWYVDDGANFQPGPHADVTTPVSGLNMKEICDYAHSKGVDVRVWVHWAALYPKLDTAFEVFEKWGLSGMMVDFMDRDDQEMVNIQNEILEKAAKHHLHIQFHGAYKPTGLQRTWPNELTREGTLNYEVNKWGAITPDHDLDIVFTRMIAGSTDYHLGGFRAVPDSQYRIQYTRPLMLGTRCHMMAMYVVLENYLGMVCDYPEAYEGQPGFEFIKEVPTTWDETRVIDAKLHEYIIIARRKGNDWYIGAINNHQARSITIPINFIQAGNYSVTLYKDVIGANPNYIDKEEKKIQRGDKIIVALASGGGMVIHVK